MRRVRLASLASAVLVGTLVVTSPGALAAPVADAPGWTYDVGGSGVTYSGPYGTWTVPAPFLTAEHGRLGGGRGSLGYPIGPETSQGGGHWYQRFERGVIYAGPRGTHAVQGPFVTAEHARLGGGGGALGYPVGPQVRQATAHWYQQFERGVVYSGPGGTFAVQGDVGARHAAAGGGGGVLGYPTSGVRVDGPGYSYQSFERGAIYSGRFGTFAVDDAGVRSLHAARGGGTGSLGYPTSDTYGSGQRFQHFERGTAYGSGGTAHTTSLTKLRNVLIANKSYALPASYNPGPDPTAWGAFDSMRAEAGRSGLSIFIASGYRTYDYQRTLYNRYVSQHGQAAADRFSARPGHSEHQSGLALDVNSTSGSFGSTAEGRWVKDNAHRFGFVVRYPQGKEHITGYMYEPWHLRYLGVDLATTLYSSGQTLEEYFGITSSYR